MTTQAAAAPEGEYIDAEIAKIDRSLNYRRTYDQADIDEMSASIKVNGVIQPIVIRPTGNASGASWWLVAGERRIRGSLAAGRKTIPAVVRRDLDEAHARAIGLIENLQRKNVPPLEEADGFKELHERLKWPVDKIATETGQKKGYVYARLKLAALCPEGRKALDSGVIDVSVALLVARVPRELQAQAIKDMGKRYDGPIPYSQARRIIDEHYMRLLGKAPFDVKDEKLVKGVGTCAACPKRTGNQAELFNDIKSGDVCTDPACFTAKSDATWRATAAKAEEAGAKVMVEAEAKKLFPYGDGQMQYGAGFVELAQKCPDDKKGRSFRKLIGKDAPIVLARDARGGVHELIAKKDLATELKAAGIKGAGARASAGDDKLRREEAQRRRQQLRRRAVTQATLAAIVAHVERTMNGAPTEGFWYVLLEQLRAGGFTDAISEVTKRRGWTHKGARRGEAFNKNSAALASAKLPALVIETMLSRDAYGAWSTTMGPALKLAVDVFKIDRKAIEKKIAEEERAKDAPKRTKVKVSKKGGRR